MLAHAIRVVNTAFRERGEGRFARIFGRSGGSDDQRVNNWSTSLAKIASSPNTTAVNNTTVQNTTVVYLATSARPGQATLASSLPVSRRYSAIRQARLVRSGYVVWLLRGLGLPSPG